MHRLGDGVGRTCVGGGSLFNPGSETFATISGFINVFDAVALIREELGTACCERILAVRGGLWEATGGAFSFIF